MNSRKTLIILTPGFAESEADTTCLPFLQSHITAINNTFPDLKVTIVAFQYPNKKGRYAWKGNTVISMGGQEKAKLSRALIWFKVWQTLKTLAKTENVAGILSLWCTECAMVGSYFAKANRLRHHIWLCGQDAKKGNKYVRRTRPAAGELIAMSDFLQREFHGNHRIEPKHVIPIGVDAKQFFVEQSERDIDILGVGSLIPLKQYDVFIDVINRLKEDIPSIKTMICGKGPEEGKLRSMIRGYQLHGNVSLAGEVPHSEVLRNMQRAKIFLHTSNYEGFGTVCLEALYAGAHVISFTRPMNHDIPHWHNVENIDEMTQKVLELLRSEKTIHSQQLPYSCDEIAGKLLALYNN